MTAVVVHRQAALGVLLALQVIFIIVYAVLVKYKPPEEHKNIPTNSTNATTKPDVETSGEENIIYPIFEDVHVMIFVGFGFLVTFLKKYAYSGVGFTFLVAALAIEWAIIVHGCFHWGSDHKIYLGIQQMISADEAAATVLISLGIVLGKVSPLGLIFMALAEILAYEGNEYLCVEVLEAMDWGGSVYLHAFGAYFGLGVSVLIAVKTDMVTLKPEESASYFGDVTAMIGTLFLWVFWPSFLAAGYMNDKDHRVIINTYLSLLASCITAFAMSSALNKQFRFRMPEIQNATLAGGVAIGTTCVAKIHPYGAMLIGAGSGALSSLGFAYVQDFLRNMCRIHDTCGAHNLHGLPGLLGGICGIFVAGFADRETYGHELGIIFPAMRDGRSSSMQAVYQFTGIAVTLGISFGSGLLTGLFIRFALPGITDDHFYKDEEWWDGNDEEQA